MVRILTTFLLILSVTALPAQSTLIKGYVYESGNRGYLSDVSITLEDRDTDRILGKTKSDAEGYFELSIPSNRKIRIYAAKDMFDIKKMDAEIGEENAFVKMEMGRAPGYTFEVTLAEKRSTLDEVVGAISGSRIEVYNNTTRQSVMDLKDHEEPTFQLNLQKGNHYTILIRKNGFLSKRMEAFVDVEGCILCIDGMGTIGPGVSDNLTEGNAFGVLLANVELERIFAGKTMEVQNLYYDLGKWNLTRAARNELNKVITLMKDNPSLTLELGSHTDSRGSSESNLELSNKRAKSAVNYLVKRRGIAKNRLTFKGYGETEILNECTNGVKCPEEDHAINRRTELKILGITDVSEIKSLAQMKKEEYMEKEILELMDQKEIRAKDKDDLQRILKERENEQSDSDILKATNNLKASALHKIEEDLQTEQDDSKYPAVKDGIKVVIYTSNDALRDDHFIFDKHPNLEIMQSGFGQIYYMLGDFDHASEAFQFQKTYILSNKNYKGSFVASIKDRVMAVVNQ